MKIQSINIKNVKSFKEETNIVFNDKFNILIGPNGAGKSNLFDILTVTIRHYLLYSYILNEPEAGSSYKYGSINKANHFQSSIKSELENFHGDESQSKIEINFKLANTDIENLTLLKSKIEYIDKLSQDYRNIEISDYGALPNIISKIRNWNLDTLHEDQVIRFEIIDKNLTTPSNPSNENTILEYLRFFNLISLILQNSDEISFHPILLLIGPYRNSNFVNSQATLSTESFLAVSHQIHSATSKREISLLKLATVYFAEKRRKYEMSKEGYLAKWESDNEVQLVNKYMQKLSYAWELKVVNSSKNSYEIILKRGNETININQASSGEKEIINFLFGIFAIGVKGGTLIIDEPELHLHPRWQNVLLDLFIELSDTTANQIIVSTHSPTFINDKSYKNIIRISKDINNISRQHILQDSDTFNITDILHIINATNNEKVFFADMVVLVEGIIDRTVFQKIINDIILSRNSTRVVEIIEIKGKGNKDKFIDFLKALGIPVFLIADFDILNEIGDDTIKGLFSVDAKKIAKDVIKNPASKDGAALVQQIEDAIYKKDCTVLGDLLEYIKSFRRKLKPDISSDDSLIIAKFIESQKAVQIYVLPNGDIEDYFPIGHKTKSLEGTIALLQEPSYKEWEQTSQFRELKTICEEIIIAGLGEGP